MPVQFYFEQDFIISITLNNYIVRVCACHSKKIENLFFNQKNIYHCLISYNLVIIVIVIKFVTLVISENDKFIIYIKKIAFPT